MFPYGPIKAPSSLASFKSRVVLPFWFWLTQVVLEKRPLNRCSSSSSSTGERRKFANGRELIDYVPVKS